jgi:hypothetical protein
MAVPVLTQQTDAGQAGAVASPTLPFSCITGVSKDVLRHIQEAALSGKAKYFLTMIALASFGNAGWQRQQGSPHPGHWCRFELSAWAREHQWSRQSVWRMRKQMEALHILRYVPDPADPQRGTLHWNLNFAEWVALDDTYRHQRYTRRGAGRPHKQDQTSGAGNAHSSEGQSQPEKSNRRHLPTHLPHASPETKSNGLHPSGHEGSSLPQKKSNGLHEPVGTQIKVMTPTTVGVPPAAGQPPVLRTGLRKKEPETSSNVSETHSVSEPSRYGVIEDHHESYSSTPAPSPSPPLGAFPNTPDEHHTRTLVTSASELATCQAACDALAEELAVLRAEYEKRLATFTAMKPHGITEIQTHIALRVEILRLQRGMEACEIALSHQQHRLKALESGDVPADNREVNQEVGESASAPVPTDAVSLQVSLEQLERWREEVRDQQREVRRIQAEYDAITEQLKFATPLSMRNWGEARGQQRFLARHLEDQQAKLTAQQIEALYATKLKEGFSPGSVQHLHAVLHKALHDAERLGLVMRNVASLAHAPRAERQEMHYFTAKQAQTFLQAISGDPLEAFYVLAINTGMRRGELLALQPRSPQIKLTGTVTGTPMDTSIRQQTIEHAHSAWEATSWITADEPGTTRANPVCATTRSRHSTSGQVVPGPNFFILALERI